MRDYTKYVIKDILSGIAKVIIVIAIIVSLIFAFFYTVSSNERQIAKLPEKTLVYRIYYSNGNFSEKRRVVLDYKLSSSRGSNHLIIWQKSNNDDWFHKTFIPNDWGYCEETTAPIEIVSFN